MNSSCIFAMRSNSWRGIAFWLVAAGSSVTTYVDPVERDTTLVWTFTLSNSVTRQADISSVKARSSSAVGLSWIFLAFMYLLTRAEPQVPQGGAILGPEPAPASPDGLAEVQAPLHTEGSAG